MKFTESQIVKAIKEHDSGKNVHDLCTELGVSTVAFYKWCQRYGGMEVKELSKLKTLAEENARLKKMYANLSLVYEVFKEAVETKALTPEEE
ncbi:transposase [Pedobacter jeongneungensis]|uniref:transposase n=1 Tax=Pedobacter jeongneungensis TaxID=947309 RepID=UPI0004A81085|nr:transposase [Pedobacter jeongneungensis]